MNKFVLLASGATASLALLAGAASAQNVGSQLRPTLVGAWQVEVTLRVDGPDCTIAPIVGLGPNPFPSLNTFNEGGTMSEWGTRTPPATRTSGHGVWQRTGYSAFRYHDMFYTFDANGLLDGTMDIRSDLKVAMDGKTLKGSARLLRTDISGNQLPFCATLSGKRITL
jgi:hypothetical protein